MSGYHSMNKRARDQRKAEKKRAKAERRRRKREEGPGETEIVSASDIVGELPTIEEAMRNLPEVATPAEPGSGPATRPVRLFVGRLSWDTTARTLRTCFEKFGEVSDVVVVEDRETGRSKGFAFVELADRRDAREVISALDGSELDGREIVVNLAQERGRRAGPSRRDHEPKAHVG